MKSKGFYRRRNPGLASSANEVLQLAMTGGLIVGGMIVYSKLSGTGLLPSIPSIGDLWKPPVEPNNCFPEPEKTFGQAFMEKPHLDFQVNNPHPEARVGIAVAYSGYLVDESKRGIEGHKIDFYDPATCTSFAHALTNSQGRFYYERPLQPDELNGYRVFARYEGSSGFAGFGDYIPAQSGIWTVVPQ